MRLLRGRDRRSELEPEPPEGGPAVKVQRVLRHCGTAALRRLRISDADAGHDKATTSTPRDAARAACAVSFCTQHEHTWEVQAPGAYPFKVSSEWVNGGRRTPVNDILSIIHKEVERYTDWGIGKVGRR